LYLCRSRDGHHVVTFDNEVRRKATKVTKDNNKDLMAYKYDMLAGKGIAWLVDRIQGEYPKIGSSSRR
jgi:hypothetical protein